ncbi:helix-turn-helix domain-containing protein [Flavilitoribacter nigricans]|uniref:helix-turn-helix domain-containing protein n=1 Tax=Flavilitoribacter nigricans TaxID=70997 RepID=UPI001474F384|nr:helix-turn-helix domain-containing protein [Flavilitoribacter nigricans]
MEQNLDNPNFSIEQLCRKAGVSRTQLHRKIKAATQLSTSHLIRKIRLEKARQLLEQTDDHIAGIAFQTGHSSPQNFSKYFVKEYGLSPSNYRKEIQQKQTDVPKENREVSELPQPEVQTPESPETASNPGYHLWKYLIAAAILLLLAGASWLYFSRTPAPEPDMVTPSIAVIPFQNYGDDLNEFYSEGVVEDILTYLTQFKGLKVISRTSTNRYKDTGKSIREIARELGVNYILEGSVRQNSQEVRITAQLIRVHDDQHIWAHRYDRPKNNAMEIQAEVARDIATSLNQSISPAQRDKLARPQTDNSEAYQALLRGRYLQRSRTRDNLYRSIDFFDEALRLDPDYSEAYAGKAIAYNLLANLRYDPPQESEFQDLAEQNALQAIKHDRDNGLAYGILGNVYAQQFRWQKAVPAFEIALELSPNSAIINYWFSLSLRYIGELERSLNYHQTASELDPLHPVIQAGYIYTSLLAGKFELADQLLAQVAPFMGDSFLYYYVLAFSKMCKKEYRPAIEAAEQALAINPSFRQSESIKMYCLGQLGVHEPVISYVNTLDTTIALECLRAARAYMGMDQPEMSLHYLERAAAMGMAPEDLPVDPIYQQLHTDPAFTAILEQFNFLPFFRNSGTVAIDRD